MRLTRKRSERDSCLLKAFGVQTVPAAAASGSSDAPAGRPSLYLEGGRHLLYLEGGRQGVMANYHSSWSKRRDHGHGRRDHGHGQRDHGHGQTRMVV